MIRVTIDLCPFGDERPEAVKEIGRMYIANDGIASVEDRSRGDYVVAVCKKGSTVVPSPVNPKGPKAVRSGSVSDYPRLAYNVWRLIARSVLACFPEERLPPSNRARAVVAMDEEILRGLNHLANGEGYNLQTDSHVKAAFDWLEAAKTVT